MEEPVGYSPWDHKELDTTERPSTAPALVNVEVLNPMGTISDKSYHTNNTRHHKNFQVLNSTVETHVENQKKKICSKERL